MRKGAVIKALTPQKQDMELINKLSRRELKEDEVYVFSLILCDNEVDRDFERFTTETLNQLAPMFVGKTGIVDHDRKSANQCARVFAAEVQVKEEKTSFGENYACIFAKAYMPKIKSNEDIIEKIDSGILREVSVGCAVEKSLCSICGKENCGHVRGRDYEGETCVKLLSGATDAYEFSFVAVPAQRKAGVTKAFGKTDEKGDERSMTEKLKSLKAGEAITLSFEEAEALKKALSWGESYRESLLANVRKFSRILQPQLNGEVLEAMTKSLDVDKLRELENVYGRLAAEKVPMSLQTAGKRNVPAANANGDFTI